MCEAIRRMTIAEEAQAAAERFRATGEPEPNPYAGTAQAAAWNASFQRYVSQLQAGEEEASA